MASTPRYISIDRCARTTAPRTTSAPASSTRSGVSSFSMGRRATPSRSSRSTRSSIRPRRGSPNRSARPMPGPVTVCTPSRPIVANCRWIRPIHLLSRCYAISYPRRGLAEGSDGRCARRHLRRAGRVSRVQLATESAPFATTGRICCCTRLREGIRPVRYARLETPNLPSRGAIRQCRRIPLQETAKLFRY